MIRTALMPLAVPLTLPLALLSLAACAEREDPAAADRLANAAMDRAATPAAAERADAPADTADAAATGTTSGGASWTARDADGSTRALYGAPNSGAQLTLACDAGARELVLTRAVDAPAGPVDVALGVGGETTLASGTVADAGMPEATVRIPASAPVAVALARGAQPLTVKVGDGPVLSVPSGAPLVAVVEACR